MRLFLISILAALLSGCGPAPHAEWAVEYDRLIAELSAIPRAGGVIAEFGRFYDVCDRLQAHVEHAPVGIDRLMDALVTADNATLRAGAAEVLGRTGDPRVPRFCVATLDYPDPFVRERAAKALSRITKQDFGEDRNAWQKYLDGKAGDHAP
ncbi:MAG: HEAT repeat domain-containing protein [Planctomycetota bacterium]